MLDSCVSYSCLTYMSNQTVPSQAHISADFKLAGMTFKLPLELRNLQMRVHARLTARPITETPPFIGSVTMTLLEKPHLDFDLPLLLPRTLWNPVHNWHGFGDVRQADSSTGEHMVEQTVLLTLAVPRHCSLWPQTVGSPGVTDEPCSGTQ